MKKYLKLMRVKHYIKNLLIFMPLIFSYNITNSDLLFKTIYTFIIFSLAASSIYIYNDLKDLEKDRIHPTKCNRPLASGKIKVKNAMILLFLLLLICIIMSIYVFRNNIYAYTYLLTYFIINIAYSYKLKQIPILDVALLAIGYILRVILGGTIINVNVSSWLYLTVLSAAFYIALSKRKCELKQEINSREVLKYYSSSFLDKHIYMCLSLAIVFYSLWCKDIINIINNKISIMLTIPCLMIISMKYNLDVEKDVEGDAVELIFKDKILVLLILLFTLIIGANYI